ncbi:MAG: DsrE family protein [Rhodocyclaceae bacterium]|nr:DsrE family protein [Rhodocyclaceae bacterium]
MRFAKTLIGLFVLFLSCLSLPASAAGQGEGIKVVYHFSEGLEQASNGLRNIRNHMELDPTAKIVVVAHGAGVNFLLKGAKDKNGNEYASTIEELTMSGVDFRVCNITLKTRNIDPKQVHSDGHIVPSGVVEVARLQAREGFVYIKP